MTAIKADKLAVQQLTDAYEMTAGSAGCSFWACPGGDSNRIVGMATCRNCAAHIMLRRALKRMGIIPDGKSKQDR